MKWVQARSSDAALPPFEGENVNYKSSDEDEEEEGGDGKKSESGDEESEEEASAMAVNKFSALNDE